MTLSFNHRLPFRFLTRQPRFLLATIQFFLQQSPPLFGLAHLLFNRQPRLTLRLQPRLQFRFFLCAPYGLFLRLLFSGRLRLAHFFLALTQFGFQLAALFFRLAHLFFGRRAGFPLGIFARLLFGLLARALLRFLFRALFRRLASLLEIYFNLPQLLFQLPAALFRLPRHLFSRLPRLAFGFLAGNLLGNCRRALFFLLLPEALNRFALNTGGFFAALQLNSIRRWCQSLRALFRFDSRLPFRLLTRQQLRLFLRALLRFGFEATLRFFARRLFGLFASLQLFFELPAVLLRLLRLALHFLARATFRFLVRPANFLRRLPQGFLQLAMATLRQQRALFGLLASGRFIALAPPGARGSRRRRGFRFQHKRFCFFSGLRQTLQLPPPSRQLAAAQATFPSSAITSGAGSSGACSNSLSKKLGLRGDGLSFRGLSLPLARILRPPRAACAGRAGESS